MAERYHKHTEPRVLLKGEVKEETRRVVEQIAGESSIGWALDELVRRYLRLVVRLTGKNPKEES
jgi:hypothetical protein